jgi:hypothetical protein
MLQAIIDGLRRRVLSRLQRSVKDVPSDESSATPAGTQPQPVSGEYSLVEARMLGHTFDRLRDSWKDVEIPQKQRVVADEALKALREGKPVAVFDALISILCHNVANLEGVRLLEIGCSSGYYSEVFAIKGLALRYVGCDYSSAFIDLARRLYPELPFDIQGATCLAYGE